jgi:very-short-patch-repair endonuclease
VRYHTSLLDRQRDAARDTAIAEAGYRVLRITEEDVWTAPHKVVQQVLAALRQAA